MEISRAINNNKFKKKKTAEERTRDLNCTLEICMKQKREEIEQQGNKTDIRHTEQMTKWKI